MTSVGVVGLGYWGPNLVRNFDELAGDPVFREALGNSLVFVAFAVPLRLLGALGLALLLHRRFAGVGAHRTAVYLPTVVPDVAYALTTSEVHAVLDPILASEARVPVATGPCLV